MDSLPIETEFRGTERFRIVRRVGAGGMGVVYEAEDRKLGRIVALKTIKHRDVELLYRMKREFRALADLSHPNLIELFDLVVEDDACFFTMELVHGVDFVAWCRPPVVDADGVQGAPALDLPRLRAALPQLVRGLDAIHAAGKIHRDIKPSNVMVAEDGRVVLLDFGLAADTSHGSLDSLDASSVAVTGTAEYMAPEQASAEGEPRPASDLYAVGVLLFEALTGRLPFTGSLFTILIDKNRKDPPRPSDLAANVPEDLERLCLDLLARDPEERPDAKAILARLAPTARSEPAPAPPAAAAAASAAPVSAFAGRAAELLALDGAFDALAAGTASVTLVLGPSGIGKSTLVREFLDRLRARRDGTVVLEGRCYERELVPFRAMDGLIDHLAHHWKRLPAAEASALLPRDASMLPRLFPVLARGPAGAAAPAGPATLDPKEVRSRAVAALRETFHRLSDRRPLVLVLDDLQWVDPGTVALLADLMRPPDPPRLMLLLSSRVEAGTALERLSSDMAAVRRRVDVGPLPETEAIALAASLLGDAPPEVARRVAKEAEGSPYFLGELARYVRAAGTADVETVRLEEMLGRRIGALSVASRRVLEVVAVAGEPIDPPLAGAAAGVLSDDLSREVGSLRAGRLLRAASGGGDALLEPYHDRIRRCALEGLDEPRRRDRHRALATALSGRGSAERLARHWAGAGEAAEAAAHARRAADEALSTHHFDHAADLYGTALDLGAPSATPAERRDLLKRRAQALANAGRCPESGDAYVLAAEGADPAERLECHRRAAEQFLVSGHVAKGLDSLGIVLLAIGERLPATPRRALLSLVWNRLRLSVRGLSWKEREASAIPPEELSRLDALLSAAIGLGMVDNIRGAVAQTRGLLLALKIGERGRVARSLAFEAIFRTSQGTRGRERARPLVAAARRIAEESKDPVHRTWAILAESFADYCGGDFPSAIDRLTEAEAWIRSETTGTTFQLNNARIFLLQSLRYLGDWGRLLPLFDEWLHDARRRGDRYAETTLVRALNGVWLAKDDPAAAREALSRSSWVPPEGFYHLQHWYDLRARAEIALYEGGDAASILPEFVRLEGSKLTRVQTVRNESRWLVGRLRLAAGDADVLDLAKRLDAERVPYAGAWALFLRAGAAATRGDDPAARSVLSEAARFADAAHLPLAAATARLRAGESEGGAGTKSAGEAAARMIGFGVVAPARMARVLAPGFPARR